ncbi:hypothetical protein NM688_g7062 [Phlebia brevispora]|uniref:Uncharacterized protein n=1 Tax=Phlebia brevispora TaxID=194682 RepID=A0ACC1S9I9_9APHY|nr:hypothetical protein NM688_g7062 [Phlebia brevispora]
MSVFDPNNIIAYLASQLEANERDAFRSAWKSDVEKRIAQMQENRIHQDSHPAQLTWVSHIVQYTMTLWKMRKVHGNSKLVSKEDSLRPLPKDLIVLGPTFRAPDSRVLDLWAKYPDIMPEQMYLKPVTLIHPLWFSELSACPGCGSNDIKWDSWTTSGIRNVHGVDMEETALGYQLRCTACEKKDVKNKSTKRRKSQFCYSTTSMEFWEKWDHWKIPPGIPHFFKRCAVMQDLWNLIIELRLSSTASGLEENIKQLHLLRYLQLMRIYYEALQQRLSRPCPKEKRVYVLLFSKPFDKARFAMCSITNDLITDIYAEFCKKTRQPESEMYLRTLSGVVVSMDATFKVAKKAAVVDKAKRHDDLMKGGILSMINESNEILAWRFCQTQHNAEITEMLEGLVTRCKMQGVDPPKMAISDTCCKTRNALTPVLGDIFIGLDVYHFKRQYMVVILNGVRNPYYREVGQDIVDAILIERAGDGKPAKYRSKEEQMNRMDALYHRWSAKGGVWSAAAPQAHAEQMRHVHKGCLSRIYQDLASDGSCIEGSHKGWNSLMRSYASGLENMIHLGHDFVLRRNIRCALRSDKLRQQRTFAASGFGSHHLSLVNCLNTQWNQLISHERGKKPGVTLTELPVMQDISSGESFGIITSACAQSFNGLVKDEDDLSGMNLWEDDDADDTPAQDIIRAMKIDPALLNTPEGRSIAAVNVLTGPAHTTAPFIDLTDESEVLTAVPPEERTVTTVAAAAATTAATIQCSFHHNAHPSQATTAAASVISIHTHDDSSAHEVRGTAAKRKFSSLQDSDSSATSAGLQAFTAATTSTSPTNGRSSKRPRIGGRHEVSASAVAHEEEEGSSSADESDGEMIRAEETQLGLELTQAAEARSSNTVAAASMHAPTVAADQAKKQTELHSFFARRSKLQGTQSGSSAPLPDKARARCDQATTEDHQGQVMQLSQHVLALLTKKLPPPTASGSLTRSQAIFTRLTAIDARSLRIDGSAEFFLFMDMREELQWASFLMNAFRWVRATKEYNTRLAALNCQNGLATIKKHPRALIETLQRVETNVLGRLGRGDFTSKSSGSTTFWTKHCYAVPLGKAMAEARSGNTRKKMVCQRCKTLMYPKPSGDPGNHKRDHCTDGAPLSSKSIPFPQPDGVFTKGKSMHVIPFLRAVQELYDKICIQGVERSDLELELDSFATLFMSRTETNKLDGNVVAFRLIPGMDIFEPNAYKEFLFEDNGGQYLRIGCL